MKLKKLILENFLTYSELEYDFEDKALLVQGINLTDANQKSNGSGKSAIQTAVEFSLTSSNSRGVNDKELVTYGFDNSRVQLFIQCDNRKETLHIDWFINTKGSNKLELKVNDKSVSFSNVNDGKKQILDWLAISKEDLFNYFIINSTRFKSFFGSSNREKVDLINRFSDSSIIDGLENIDNSILELEKSNISHIINKSEGKLELLESKIAHYKNYDFAADLQNDKDVLNDEIEILEAKIVKQEWKKENLNKDLSDIKPLVKANQDKIKSIEESVKAISLEIEDAEKVSIKNKKIVDADKIALEKFQYTDNSLVINSHNKKIDDIQSEMKTNNLGRDSVQNNISKIEKFMKGIEVKLSGTIECPKCAHNFILDGDREVLLTKESQAVDLLNKYSKELENFDKVEDDLFKKHVRLKDLLILIDESVAKERKLLNSLEDDLSDSRAIFNKSIDILTDLKNKSLKTASKISDVNEEIRELNFEAKEIMLDKKSFDNKIKEAKEAILEFKDKISNLKIGNGEDLILELRQEIKDIELGRSDLDAKLIIANDKIYDRNKWSNNFKQFRLHLANKSLETMQYRTNEFLKELGNDIVVRLDGYKIKANGTVKEEISAVIIRDGERTFSSLSGGEQVRVLFSSILANRYLINSTHPYGGLDFLSVDEVFDKIDSLGMKYLIRSARKLETCIMIISHVSDEDLAGEEILTIVKENGISTIKQ